MSTLTKPYTFAPNTYAVAQQVNANFDAIFAWINNNGIWADASTAFTAIPSGPALDPTTPNQFVRKGYIDDGCIRNGTAANGALVQGALLPFTTDSGGVFTITFPTAFPNTCYTAVASIATTAQGANMAVLLNSPSRTAVTGRVIIPSTNSGLNNTTIPISYIALGT